MLAQNFLTHDMLRISEAEREALIRVLGMLERGELMRWDGKTAGFRMFDMDEPFEELIEIKGKFFWQKEVHCGTIACIGGWTAFLMGHDAPRGYVTGMRNRGLRDLFFPPDTPEGYEVITTEQAAQATRNYLTTGHSDWHSVLGLASEYESCLSG